MSSQLSLKRWGFCVVIAFYVGAASATASAQGFSSGSTGADGPFAPVSSQTLQLPPSGVFNFTTVNIPSGVLITFTRNANNTPVTILATGNVVINGTISVAGQSSLIINSIGPPGGLGGPGGFNGGRGGTLFEGFITGLSGDGPGGGGGGGSVNGTNVGTGGGGGFAQAGGNGYGQNVNAVVGQGGLSYGSRTLLPLIGGSGGGGGGAILTETGAPGGGGGGALLIASSGNITFGDFSAISAAGGEGQTSNSVTLAFGGNGSGGAIRLIANQISGTPTLDVKGGSIRVKTYNSGGIGSHGYIRVEAFNYSSFKPTLSPTPTGINSNLVSFAAPGLVTLANLPQLRILSVAGVNAPATPVGSFGSPPDIVLPSSQTNPVSVAIKGINVPLSTVVRVIVASEFGPITSVNSTPLAGTVADSSATASVTLPVAVSLLTATAAIDSSLLSAHFKPLFINGERVMRMEIAASFGGQSEVTYITESGKRIK